jgi:hypothetical protein
MVHHQLKAAPFNVQIARRTWPLAVPRCQSPSRLTGPIVADQGPEDGTGRVFLRRLTTCASAAGLHALPRTNLRSTARSGRAVAERRSRPLRPVGCMRGLGTEPAPPHWFTTDSGHNPGHCRSWRLALPPSAPRAGPATEVRVARAADGRIPVRPPSVPPNPHENRRSAVAYLPRRDPSASVPNDWQISCRPTGLRHTNQ